jgi:hypothetical protein
MLSHSCDEHAASFLSFVFESAGTPLKIFIFSETARPQIGLWQKYGVNLN